MSTYSGTDEQAILARVVSKLKEAGWRNAPGVAPSHWQPDAILSDGNGVLLCLELKFGTRPLHSRILTLLTEARDQLENLWSGPVYLALITNNPVSPRVQAALGSTSVILVQTQQKPTADEIIASLRSSMRYSNPTDSRDVNETSSPSGLINEAALAVDRRDWQRAIVLYRRVIDLQTEIFGPSHPVVTESRNRLTQVLATAGNVQEAVAEAEELVAEQRSGHPTSDRDRFATRANLARLLSLRYRASGNREDLDNSIAQYKDLLEDEVRVLGPHNLLTYEVRADLAKTHILRFDALRDIADLNLALTQFESLLHDEQGMLGPDDLMVFDTRASIANALARRFDASGDTGDLIESLKQLERLLYDHERVFGTDHPKTFAIRASLASLLEYRFDKLGDSADLFAAIRQHENLLRDKQRTLGSDHPLTLGTRIELANLSVRKFEAFGDSADLDSAILLYRDLVADEMRAFGASDPLTFSARYHVAQLLMRRYHLLGHSTDLGEALTQYEGLLTEQRTTFGPNDARTRRTEEDFVQAGRYTTD